MSVWTGQEKVSLPMAEGLELSDFFCPFQPRPFCDSMNRQFPGGRKQQEREKLGKIAAWMVETGMRKRLPREVVQPPPTEIFRPIWTPACVTYCRVLAPAGGLNSMIS